jgi:5-methylcytosine-specific restriction endonuclease McrA
MPEPQISSRQRKLVAERAKHCCEYCQSQARFAIQPFSVEHILPKSLGGQATLGNMALACQGCNNHKYNKVEARDPVTGALVPLYHPRQHRWEDHFVWNEDYTLIMGTTPTGRATVEALRLNRQGLVNLRRVLYAMGEHPPAQAG